MDVIGCTPIQLERSHVSEICKLIASLPEAVKNGLNNSNDFNFERFEKLVALYGDEPQLLDSILREMVDALLCFVSWPESSQSPLSDLSLAALSRLRVVTRIRGYKIMIRILPHEVTYLNNVLMCLEYYASRAEEAYSSVDSDRRMIFMLTVWLLIICKNPFSLTKFDGSIVERTSKPVAQRIVDCMTTLQDHYIPQGELSVVSTLLAQIMTRNENNAEVLAPRIAKSMEVLKEFDSETDGGKILISHLRLLISLFKWPTCRLNRGYTVDVIKLARFQGKRNEMRSYATELLQQVSSKILNMDCVNIEVRNLVTKLLQRVALVLLKPKLASWRYKCGFRSLEESLKGKADGEATQGRSENKMDEDQEDGVEIPYAEIETIISEILLKINDRDNLVRWTAAKGVARICSRLPRELAAEVVASILSSSFDESMVGGTWHGGCLALAELCRRGCLLPDQVPEVVRLLSRALLFEQSHIGFSVSVNVRDAACYICWAFARAYQADVLRDHVQSLTGELAWAGQGPVLACLALFDREVNIRRAASAAFQENVGRNDCFPCGIHVLTIIDYIDVALIKKCYLELAVRVAEHKEYRLPMLDHLLRLKAQHWDETIRELASESLQCLAQFDVDYSLNVVLPELFARFKDKDPAIVHGALFAVSGVLIGLFHSGNLCIQSLPQLNVLLKIVPKNISLLKDHRVKGFMLLSKAISRFIEALCLVGTTLNDELLKQFHDVLDTVISDRNKKLHSYAAEGFAALMNYYGGERFNLLLERIFKKYFTMMEEANEQELVRCAGIAPLAHIPKKFLMVEVEFEGRTTVLAEVVVEKLLRVVSDKSTPNWVFARVAANETITAILSTCVPPNFYWAGVIESCIQLSDDYTSTVNGDIGRFARKAAVVSLGQLLQPAFQSSISIPQATIDLAVGKVVQRCSEPIDDLRCVACSTLTALLQTELPMEERDLLVEVFCLSSCLSSSEVGSAKGMGEQFSEVDWKHSQGFMRLVRVLESGAYRQFALEGFILSAGSVSEWTSQSAFLAVVKHLKPIKKDVQALELFLTDVIQILHGLRRKKSDSSCVLQLFRMLLNERIFAVYEKEPDKWPIFNELIEEVVKLAVGRGKPKIKSLAVSVLGSLLQVNPNSQLYHKCMSLVVSMLESPYIVLREKAMEQLFETLNGLSDLDTALSNQQKAVEILTDTPWTSTNEGEKTSSSRKELLSLLLL